MSNFSRREFLASTAGTTALGLSGSLVFLTPAQAADVKAKGYYKYKVGSDIEVISIYDGVWQKPHDENFALGGSIEEVKAALREADKTDEHVPIEFTYTIVKTGGKTVLIDAGTGAQLAPTAGLGAQGMAAAGIKTSDIDTVLISHMHPDHIFGLMAKDTNEQIFPNAEIMVGETEYNYWTSAETLANLPEGRKPLAQRIQATFPKWKNVTLYSADKELLPGIRSVDTSGHTAGHMAFHISSGDDEMMLLGDMINMPALFLENLDWQIVFDADKEKASKARKQMIDRAVADNITVAGYHFGFPNSGKIEKEGSNFVFNPVEV